MEVSGQLHAPDALLSGKLGELPELAWNWRRQEIVPLPGIKPLTQSEVSQLIH
jgi:hypothetical protein